MSAADRDGLPAIVPSRTDRDGAHGAGLAAAIERLLEIVEEENRRLEAGGPVSVEDSVQKKSRALLELTRLSRVPLRGNGTAPALAARLTAVRDLLARNERLLLTHMRAAREVAAIVAASLAREDWDGTYEAPAAGGAAKGARP